MQTYLIYEIETGICINAVLWDGNSPYSPPSGYVMEMKTAENVAWIGWTKTAEGNWQPPIIENAAE